MLRAWRRISIRPPVALPLIFLGTVALISVAAAQITTAAPLARGPFDDCSSPGAAARAAGRQSHIQAAVAQRLDPMGQFLGRDLTLNAAGRQLVVTLPPDSSISDPRGDAVLYTRSTGGKSEIHLVDVSSACDAVIARQMGVVRSVILDPAGTSLYVHSVTFPSRTDAGVSRYALDGGAAQVVVPPLQSDDRFGLTFGTQLGWSTDGATLSVQSCGALACRTRLLSPTTGAVTTFDETGHGQIIGVTPRHLITYGACNGLPCSVLGTDLASGVTTTIAAEAWSAHLNGATLTIETAAGNSEVTQ